MIELCHWVTVPLLWSSLRMNDGYMTDWPALLAEVLLRSWHFSWTKLSGKWVPWILWQSLRASCGHAAATTTIWNGAWSKWPIFAWTERFHRKRCSQLTFLVRKVSRKGNLTQMADKSIQSVQWLGTVLTDFYDMLVSSTIETHSKDDSCLAVEASVKAETACFAGPAPATRGCSADQECRSQIPWTFYQNICQFKFKTRRHWKLTDCFWTCCHWLWLNLSSSLTLLKLVVVTVFELAIAVIDSSWTPGCLGGRAFRITNPSECTMGDDLSQLKQSRRISRFLMASSGSHVSWHQFHQPVNDGLFLHFVPLSVNDICSTRSVNDSLCWR